MIVVRFGVTWTGNRIRLMGCFGCFSRLGLETSACLVYLRDHLHFTLGARERLGLRLFRRRAAELGFVSGQRSLATQGTMES